MFVDSVPSSFPADRQALALAPLPMTADPFDLLCSDVVAAERGIKQEPHQQQQQQQQEQEQLRAWEAAADLDSALGLAVPPLAPAAAPAPDAAMVDPLQVLCSAPVDTLDEMLRLPPSDTSTSASTSISSKTSISGDISSGSSTSSPGSPLDAMEGALLDNQELQVVQQQRFKPPTTTTNQQTKRKRAPARVSVAKPALHWSQQNQNDNADSHNSSGDDADDDEDEDDAGNESSSDGGKARSKRPAPRQASCKSRLHKQYKLDVLSQRALQLERENALMRRRLRTAGVPAPLPAQLEMTVADENPRRRKRRRQRKANDLYVPDDLPVAQRLLGQQPAVLLLQQSATDKRSWFIESASGSFASLTGLRAGLSLGPNLSTIAGPETDSAVASKLVTALQRGERLCETLVCYRPDKSVFHARVYVSSTISPRTAKAGASGAVRGLMVITEMVPPAHGVGGSGI